MDQNTLHLVVAGAIVLVLALLIAAVARAGRRRRLHDRFGPEYDRAVEVSGRKAAEAELLSRQRRMGRLSLRALTDGEREAYVAEWDYTQALFVDEPSAAVTRADRLLGQAMESRGYPLTDFDQQSADLSVEHPVVVQNYRAAHAIALRHDRGEASTEELRQAMIHFRNLFDELVGTHRPARKPEPVH